MASWSGHTPSVLLTCTVWAASAAPTYAHTCMRRNRQAEESRLAPGASVGAWRALTVVGACGFVDGHGRQVGVSTTAAAPILLELVAEVTYPHPEIVSAGVCLTVFGLSTFGFVQLSQVFAPSPPLSSSATVAVVCPPPSIIQPGAHARA
jgi:hypothetical protein